MKTIGLLGGMSWESSIEYEQLINKEVRRRLGGSHSDLLIRSYDFAEIEAFQEAGDWAAAGSRLEATPGGLQGAGVELASIRRARSTLPSSRSAGAEQGAYRRSAVGVGKTSSGSANQRRCSKSSLSFGLATGPRSRISASSKM
jgi:hypothetical protein